MRITYASPPTDYRFISTDGPFRAVVAEATGLWGDHVDSGMRSSPAARHRREALQRVNRQGGRVTDVSVG